MKVACLGDLHYGIDAGISRKVRSFLAGPLAAAAPDLVVIAGDLAETWELPAERIGERHAALLAELRAAVSCPIAFCCGNHDLWSSDPQIDSRALYQQILPRVAREGGATCLDEENLLLSELVVVGCYGHYDFSLATPDLTIGGVPVTGEHYLRQTPPGFPGPVWMDGTCIRWAWDDPTACREICAAGLARMEAARETGRPIVFVSHGVPRRVLNGHDGSPDPISRFLNAFSGTERLEAIIRRGASGGIPMVAVSGHTHRRVRPQEIDGVHYLNVGGDYGNPRMDLVAFPEGSR